MLCRVQHAPPFSVAVPLLLFVLLNSFVLSVLASADTVERLDVHTKPQGGVVAQATVHLAASPAIVQAVLTDYEHWPELFSVSMRMARIERYPDRTVTEIYINHGFMSGERRLLCENREVPGGGLTTTLLGGDFKHYSRIWKLGQNGVSGATRAEFRMEVEVDTWAPDWLVGTMLKQELKSHFQLLKTKIDQRASLSIGH